MQQESETVRVRRTLTLRLNGLQGGSWDEIMETGRTSARELFPSNARLVGMMEGDLRRCFEWDVEGDTAGQRPKRFYAPYFWVRASWTEEQPRIKDTGKRDKLTLRVVQGDTWEDIRKAALAEGALAFPSAKWLTLGLSDGPIQRRTAWTGKYPFAADPKKYYITDVTVRGHGKVDEKSST